MAEQDKKAGVTIYGAEWCPPCHMTKDYLKSIHVAYNYINIDEDPAAGQMISEKTGWRSIPIIEIGKEYILGFDKPRIDAALKAGGLAS